MLFAQLRCCAVEHDEPSASQIPAADISAATAVHTPDQLRLRIVFRSSSQAKITDDSAQQTRTV
jgi:hypothetical protein